MQFDSPSERTILDVLGVCYPAAKPLRKDNTNLLLRGDFYEDDTPGIFIQNGNSYYNYGGGGGHILNDCTSSREPIVINCSENSLSTNNILNNFLEEKKKELEALEEMDRESDTTEQMTFSHHSSRESSFQKRQSVELPM